MKKWLIIAGCMLLFGIIISITWNYFIPSQDIQTSFKNLRADAAGLNRKITHCVNDQDCMTWQGVTKIYPFPDTKNSDGAYSGSGAAFSFTIKGQKVICGPGWRVIEQ
jgi:hypothetical protein